MMRHIKSGENGYIMVEATILFPIMIMIFFGLVLMSMYLPQRAILQYATQHAATAIAVETSDSWVRYDTTNREYYRIDDKRDLDNVYMALLGAIFTGSKKETTEDLVVSIEGDSITLASSELEVECKVLNVVVYKEIMVTATSTFKSPVDFSFIGFPSTIPITASSTAVVQNADEFIRNVDIAVDLLAFFKEKYNIDTTGITESFTKVRDFLGV